MVHWPVKSGNQPKDKGGPAKPSLGASPAKSAPWLDAAAERLEVARASATEAVGQPPWRTPATTAGGHTGGSSPSSKAATTQPDKGPVDDLMCAELTSTAMQRAFHAMLEEVTAGSERRKSLDNMFGYAVHLAETNRDTLDEVCPR